jgi:YD repeat-containing protein
MRNGIRALAMGFGLALAGPGASVAETDFATMPEGCSWTTRYSDGQVQTETYLGLKDGKHRTQVTSDGDLVREMTYDAKGRMVRKDWADGNWETFTPFSCFDTLGSCSYRYRNSDGANQKIVSETVKNGKGFNVAAGPDDGAPYPDEYFEIGPFGIMTKNKASNYSSRLTEMQNCGLES